MLRLRHKLVDVDRAGGFERDVFQLVLRHLDVGVGIHLVALDDVVVRDFLARVGINLRVFDPVAGLLVDLVEADLLGIGSGRVQSDRAGNEGKAQKAFPVGTGGHWVLQTQLGTGGFKTILVHSFLQSSFKKFTLQTRSTFVLMCNVVLRRTKLVRWYDANAENPAWIKALADVRRMGTLEGYCYQHVQAIMIAFRHDGDRCKKFCYRAVPRLPVSCAMPIETAQVQLYAFDILALNGEDLRKLPLSMRKTNLAR